MLVAFRAVWGEPELVVQEGHSEHVEHLKYSNDGKFLLSLDHSSAKIWDIASCFVLKNIKTAPAYHAADLSYDGKKIAYASPDGAFVLRDLVSNKKIQIAKAGGKPSHGFFDNIFFSLDNSFVVGTERKWGDEIFVYDIARNSRRVISQKNMVVTHGLVAISKDSARLICVSGPSDANNTMYFSVYDLKNNKTLVYIGSLDLEQKGLKLKKIDTSFDNRYIAAFFDNYDVILFDEKTRTSKGSAEILKRISISGLKDINFLPDGTLLCATTNGLQIWDYKNGRKLSELGSPCDVGTASPQKGVYCVAKNLGGSAVDQISVWSSHSGALQERNLTTDSPLGNLDVLYSEKSKNFTLNRGSRFALFSGSLEYKREVNQRGGVESGDGVFFIKETDDKNNTHIYFYNLLTGTEREMCVIKKYIEPSKRKFSVARNLGEAASVVALSDGVSAYLYSIANEKLLKTFKLPHSYDTVFVGPNEKFLTFSWQREVYGKKQIEFFDITKNKLVKLNIGHDSISNKLLFSKNEDYMSLVSFKAKGVELSLSETSALMTAKDRKDIITLPRGIGNYAFKDVNVLSSKGTYVLLSEKMTNETIVFDLRVKKIAWRLDYPLCVTPYADKITRSFFTEDESILTLVYDDKALFFSTQTGELLATIITHINGDWLTYTPEGYFNGSEGGIKKFVHLVDGMKVTELGQVGETLFRPDLVTTKLRGEDISAAVAVSNSNENSPAAATSALQSALSTGEAPIVQFTQNPATTKSRDITVNFSVQDMGGGIGSVYLKLNDKVIQLADGSRKLELIGGKANATQKQSGKTVPFVHLLTLQNGENTIEAYATNSAGKIESRHAVTKISWQGNTAKPNLYVLAVGVNKYRDRALWLNYAVPDASSIADSFRGVKGNLYQNVSVTTVFDDEVTSSGISAVFNSLAGKVSADDVFIFYLSGHGTTHADGDYYFIPVDFRFRNAESVLESAVSKHFITEQLSKIKAQKTLVMLDTCNSGAFISTGARGMAEKTAIDRLSRATGQAIIAASSDTQSAMEGYNGHGIFTYVILEGLAGKADLNKDGYVSLSELSQYAEDKVPDYSYAKWGYEQYPQVDLRKQSNFPLVGK